jgi:RNA polymerase primary sigma factor
MEKNMTTQQHIRHNTDKRPAGFARSKISKRVYRNADSSLLQYFRFIGNRKSLNAEEESAAAENIFDLEHALWEAILGDRGYVRGLSTALGKEITGKTKNEVEVISTAKHLIADFLKQSGKRPSRNKAGDDEVSPVTALAQALYVADEDRTLVTSALQYLARQKETAESAKRLAYHTEVSRLDRQVRDAKKAFIQENLGLVVNIAKRYHVEKMPLADLIQEGNLGLIRAVDKFDYSKGFRFSTYASWWIRSYISRAIVRKSNTVRIPEYMLRDRNRIRRTEEASRVKNGRAPNEEELATELGLSKKRLSRTRKHDVAFVESLDREMPGSDSQRYIDFLSDEEAKGPLENVEYNAWVRDIPKTLGQLSVTERFVICWRFGLLDGEEMTLQEIGKCLNLSRERIRQIQEEALLKLRTRLEVDAA